MENSAIAENKAAYDSVGAYNQNQINGFSTELLDTMISFVEPQPTQHVLDAMAGDGNLTEYLLGYCKRRGITPPKVSVLEYSRVQSEFARARLAQAGKVDVIWGDVLSMINLSTGEQLPDESFDKVMIKSANHELPLAKQYQLYESVWRVLKPGGVFVNLGFLFDNQAEQNEMRSIARVKDTLAEMHDAVANRHFLTRDELYDQLHSVGFIDTRAGKEFNYHIKSDVVAKNYFARFGEDLELQYDIEHQIAQLKAIHLRRKGRILFDHDTSIMCCPGEVTVARKPAPVERLVTVYSSYPYEFVQHIEAHRRVLDECARAIPPKSAVLDLGCGLGLLAEKLLAKHVRYLGMDLSEAFIQQARERFVRIPDYSFERTDINKVELDEGTYDIVTLLNVLYQAGIEPLKVLRKAHAALRPGGALLLTGPFSAQSFALAEPHIRAQLEREGLLPQHEETYREICNANAKLLTAQGNYWSLEGITALLTHAGFSSFERVSAEHYYGQSYFVVAKK